MIGEINVTFFNLLGFSPLDDNSWVVCTVLESSIMNWTEENHHRVLFLIVVIFISIWITLSNISPHIKCFMDCGGAYSTYILYSNTWMGGIHGEYAEEHPDDDDDIQNFILSIKITHLVSFPSCNSLTSGVPLIVDIGL